MTQIEWEPVPEGEPWEKRLERRKQERNEFELLRAKTANDFQEVLRSQPDNTSLEIVKEAGWYLWLHFARRNKMTLRGRVFDGNRFVGDSWTPSKSLEYWWEGHYNWANFPYCDIVQRDTTFEEMQEIYESRFQEALEEWTTTKGRQSRLGTNFLAFVCYRDKSRVSEKITSWAYHYRHKTNTETPEELAHSKIFDLLFVDADEYSKIMKETDDIFEAAKKCEEKRLEILAKRKRFVKLFKKVSSNLWVVVKKGGQDE